MEIRCYTVNQSGYSPYEKYIEEFYSLNHDNLNLITRVMTDIKERLSDIKKCTDFRCLQKKIKELPPNDYFEIRTKKDYKTLIRIILYYEHKNNTVVLLHAFEKPDMTAYDNGAEQAYYKNMKKADYFYRDYKKK